jgi:2-polyprenyl-3-methyl-5-hydroxy-6-metoxy-1,4-benzoquinol methylase
MPRVAVAEDPDREAWFQATRVATRDYYLADPSNPYQQSGRSTGARRWEETRRPIAAGVHRSGTFLDVGCANGLLLQCVEQWVGERGLSIAPHGLDFVAELLELASRRVPHGTFHLGNAWSWVPPRRYTFVRSSIETVPVEDRGAFVRRQHSWVEPGGRLILCWYPDQTGPVLDVPRLVEDCNLEIGGILRPDDHTVVWVPG